MTHLLLLAACSVSGPKETGDSVPPDTDGVDTDALDTDPLDTDPGDTDPPEGPCPPEMALAGTACVDRWEASIVDHSPYEVPIGGTATAASGGMPQGYISGEVAAGACAAAGKRLCSLDEWMRACQGPDGFVYPYGNTYDATACNTTRATHPVIDYWGNDPDAFDAEHMNDPGINQQPDTVDASGANPGCVTPEGVFDLHGNLHEWIDDPEVINGAGCGYTTSAHDFGYHDYSTGFRCCRDPA
jgi:sulfatase modifying factor 1